MRWLAVLVVFGIVTVAHSLFHAPIRTGQLYLIGALLAVWNVLLFALCRAFRIAHDAEGTATRIIANIQIAADLLVLAALIHFAGGVENPFAFYFIFHIIVSGTVLSPKQAWLQAGVAILLFCGMVELERLGMLAHHHVPSLAPPDLYRNPLFVTATVAAFASTMCMATFTAISITRLVRIRQRESEALIVQLKQAYLQLGEVERSKSQHMRRVSHELRAPLAAIQNLLTMLEEVMTGEGRSAERELAGRAAKRVNQALKLVGDLTILARSQDARFTARMRELPLGPIIREVVGSLQGRAETEQVAVKVDLADNLPAILGDPESIEQLLTNLTGNAIKYTPPGGQVVVTAERRDEHVLVRVADTGIGIAEDDLPHLFEEFYRGKNARERTEHGTGLGLSIVRSIADMHGADIRVESEIDRGSTFEVMLPRADVAAAKQAQGT